MDSRSSPGKGNNDGSDREMERVLREHFESESSDLRMSKDPWDWLESRMGEPSSPPILSRIVNSFGNIFQLKPGPVFSAAGAAAVVLVAIFVTLNVLIDDQGDQLNASLPLEATPEDYERVERAWGRGPAATAAPAPTAAPVAAAPTMAPAPAPTMAPTPRPTPPRFAATAAPTMAPIPRATMAPTPTRQRFIPEVTAMPTSAPTMAPTAAPASRPTTFPTAAAQSGGTASATTFRDYARERFVSAAEDNVSTFSLDTDRTSYFLALNWARNGFEVDPDSVRAEEWINAFNYGYDQPRRNDSFNITTDVVTHPLDSRMHLARIAFQAPELDYDATPVNVTLVLDASGSMSNGNRVDIAREAAESILEGLRDQDRIAVVLFNENVLHEYTVEHTHPNDFSVERSIQNLRPGGSTNVQAGLNEGVWLADQARRQNPDTYNYIILMSDGVANVDATDPFAILESTADYDDSNPLRLITIGVGIENFNDFLLEQLAQHGNGWYRYLSDVNQAHATFARENWLALSIPFADATRAQVTWDPNVVNWWRIVGYENRVTSDESFTQARRKFAEIPAGTATTVFYELELKDQWFTGPLTLGDVELRWVTPSSQESNRQHAPVTSHNFDFNFADPLLRLGAVVALFADRYSSLPYPDSASRTVLEDLLFLQMQELQLLETSLGNLDAYRDAAFLLEHITRNSLEATRGSSGYSR